MKLAHLLIPAVLAFQWTNVSAQQQIAVTDLSYKKEIRESFYFEASDSKSSVSAASSFQASGHDRSTREASASVTGAATRNAAYVSGSASEKSRNDVAFQAKANSVYASNSQSSHVKTYGDKVRVQYTELQGMSGDVRAALIKAGYRLIQTPPSVAKPGQTDEFFDVVNRVKTGVYAGADYVLYGVLAGMETTSTRNAIQGSDAFMYKNELNLTVDYSLIETKSMRTVAAFTVMATGEDNRLDGPQSTYKPSSAKMMSTAAKALSEEVLGKLYDQGFLTKPANAPVKSNAPQPTYRDEPSTLKVFK
jgi:hypothetical protein